LGFENREAVADAPSGVARQDDRSDAWLLTVERLPELFACLEKKLLQRIQRSRGGHLGRQSLEALEGRKRRSTRCRNLGRTARIVKSKGRKSSPAQIEAIRCELLLLARKPDEALKACNLASEIDELHGEVMVPSTSSQWGARRKRSFQAKVVAKARAAC